MKPIRQSVFRAYDIRGIVDEDFDGDWVETLGRACGTYFQARGLATAVVGHDCRHSSPEYQERMVAGLTGTGTNVVTLGMVPTPLVYYAITARGTAAGVTITASHNPPQYNGFKVWAGVATIHTEEIQKIYRIMDSGNYAEGHGTVEAWDVVPEYLDFVARDITLERPLKIVLDGGNGSGGLVCAEALRRIGAEVVDIYCEPDGDFPNHHPDPVIEANLEDLKAAVVREGADAGFGLDGDADRIGVIDEQGKMIYGDRILAILARDVLADNPGALVLGDVKCSHLVFKDIAEHGGEPLMWTTGHSVVKAKMHEAGALMAGELSGHMFFNDRLAGYDDAIYACARMASIMARKPGEPLSGYLAAWPVVHSTPELHIKCPEEAKFDVIKKAQDFFRDTYDMIDVDGVRLTFSDGWGLVRASNTQPVLVLRFEAESPERLAEIQALVEEPVRAFVKEASEALETVA